MMDKHKVGVFQKRLEQMDAELRESVEEKADAAAPVQVDPSIGRLSRMDAIQSQQLALEIQARQQRALMRVRSALESIQNGTYGQCRRCKGPIGLERLEAQPDAVVCIKCAESGQR